MNTNSKLRAVGYVRVSTEEQIQGHSLDAQRSEIERYCERNGCRLERFYADEGVSAPTDDIKPESTNGQANWRRSGGVSPLC